jgi:hypothetical protein
MAAVHELSSGMGGIRTAGDLVSRMVMKGMRLSAAKEFVADKLHCSVLDLSDTFAMKEIRESLDIGTVLDRKGASNGMEAKFNIEKVLGIEIPSVTQFKKKTGLI